MRARAQRSTFDRLSWSTGVPIRRRRRVPTRSGSACSTTVGCRVEQPARPGVRRRLRSSTLSPTGATDAARRRLLARLPGGTADGARAWSACRGQRCGELLGAEIVDDERNRNNRFAVAARLNSTMSVGRPLLGMSVPSVTDVLTATKPPSNDHDLPSGATSRRSFGRRAIDRSPRGSCWAGARRQPEPGRDRRTRTAALESRPAHRGVAVHDGTAAPRGSG